MKNNSSILLLFFLLLFNACKKSTAPYNSNVNSPITIGFDNIVADQALSLNTNDYRYKNSNEENYNISLLQYFVSNFVFTKLDGSTYTVPKKECYFLINQAIDSSQEITMNIPEGEYNQVSFIVGVDSSMSVADIAQRSGVLDIAGAAADMYWSWNSGYIFFKLEGNANLLASGSTQFKYHIGLYGGGYNGAAMTLNNIRTVRLDLNKGIPKVKTGNIAPHLHFMVDINKFFHGCKIIDHPVVMSNAYSATLANNFASMFSHDHTEQ